MTNDKKTYREQVQDFYGIIAKRGWISRVNGFTECKWGPFVKYESRSEGEGKMHEVPIGLIGELEKSSGKHFDTSKLTYEQVRKDYRAWQGPLRKTIRGLMMFGGIAGASALGTYALVEFQKGNNELGIPLAILAAASFCLPMSTIGTNFPKPRKTNRSLDEYLKLRDTAVEVDTDWNK